MLCRRLLLDLHIAIHNGFLRSHLALVHLVLGSFLLVLWRSLLHSFARLLGSLLWLWLRSCLRAGLGLAGCLHRHGHVSTAHRWCSWNFATRLWLRVLRHFLDLLIGDDWLQETLVPHVPGHNFTLSDESQIHLSMFFDDFLRNVPPSARQTRHFLIDHFLATEQVRVDGDGNMGWENKIWIIQANVQELLIRRRKPIAKSHSQQIVARVNVSSPLQDHAVVQHLTQLVLERNARPESEVELLAATFTPQLCQPGASTITQASPLLIIATKHSLDGVSGANLFPLPLELHDGQRFWGNWTWTECLRSVGKLWWPDIKLLLNFFHELLIKSQLNFNCRWQSDDVSAASCYQQDETVAGQHVHLFSSCTDPLPRI